MPDVPAPDPSWHVEAAADYAGRYTGAGGRALEIVADGERLFLMHRGERVTLEPSIDVDNAFVVRHPEFEHFGLLFTRAGADGKGAVVEAGWAGDWYAAPGYSGPRTFETPADWHRYAGHYRSEDPWIGSHRIVSRRGKLWMDGVVPLEPAADGRYYLRDEPTSPEWVAFTDVVADRAMRMCFSGFDLRRV